MANGHSKYAKQRPKVPAPVVTLAATRKAMGVTLQTVCDRINEEHGFKVDRGTISGVELGYRGASTQLLTAIADALGIPVEAIDTKYEPRRSPKHGEAVA